MAATHFFVLLLLAALTTESQAEACTSKGGNCNVTGCCEDQSLKCFEKNREWATCLLDCKPGIHAGDPEDLQTPWSCVTPEKKGCSAKDDNCLSTGCCQDPALKCYEKNSRFAGCRASCKVGKHEEDAEEYRTDWTCKALSTKCADAFEKCGGEAHSGVTCCRPGCHCDRSNSLLRLCLPDTDDAATCEEALESKARAVSKAEEIPELVWRSSSKIALGCLTAGLALVLVLGVLATNRRPLAGRSPWINGALRPDVELEGEPTRRMMSGGHAGEDDDAVRRLDFH